MSHKKHHVKVHKWFRGILETVHHEFESLEAALGFTHVQHRIHENAIHEFPTEQVVKIYDEDGGLVHSTDGSYDSYA